MKNLILNVVHVENDVGVATVWMKGFAKYVVDKSDRIVENAYIYNPHLKMYASLKENIWVSICTCLCVGIEFQDVQK